MSGLFYGICWLFGFFIVRIVASIIAEGEKDGGADERVLLTDFAFKEAFPGPVKQT